ELDSPRIYVLSLGLLGFAQYALKNNGKKPAMTVVANAELAQSYKAHERQARLSSDGNKVSLGDIDI
ncbi:MAG: hypothetical protein QF535_14705, partial [Anaerolineales bacterium]|nr:hypothetical protein [Anaerolineales bacterium]